MADDAAETTRHGYRSVRALVGNLVPCRLGKKYR
jgi:hypothetical protein